MMFLVFFSCWKKKYCWQILEYRNKTIKHVSDDRNDDDGDGDDDDEQEEQFSIEII